MTMEELVDTMGFAYEKKVDVNPPSRFNVETLWVAITGRNDFRVSAISNNRIEHPVLRLFGRLLVATVFGKDDVSKLNKQDLGIMGQYLNVERRKAFKMNATIMFAA